MNETDHGPQERRPQVAGEQNLSNSTARRENLNPPEQDRAGSVMMTRLTPSSDLLNLGSQTSLIELFPMAAYAVQAPDGVIVRFNCDRAAQLWGRVPALGDTDERFCGAYKLYYPDGTHMAHCDTPVALALKTGASVHEQEVIIEKPDGSRVTVFGAYRSYTRPRRSDYWCREFLSRHPGTKGGRTNDWSAGRHRRIL